MEKKYTTAQELRDLKAMKGKCKKCQKLEVDQLCMECYLVYKTVIKK